MTKQVCDTVGASQTSTDMPLLLIKAPACFEPVRHSQPTGTRAKAKYKGGAKDFPVAAS